MTPSDMERLADEASIGWLSAAQMEYFATEAIYDAWRGKDRERNLLFALQMVQGIKNATEAHPNGGTNGDA